MARVSQADLDRAKEAAIKYFREFPAGAMLLHDRTPIRDKDMLALSFFHGVLNVLSEKGLLKEAVDILIDTETTESVWEQG